MIFFFGSGFLTFLGVIFFIILLISGSFAVWLAEHAIGTGIVLIILHLCCSISTVETLHERFQRRSALLLSLLRVIPPVAVLVAAYPYLQREIALHGVSEAAFDLAVCLGIYFAASCIWRKLVIDNGAAPGRTVFLTLAHLLISCFFILAFLFAA